MGNFGRFPREMRERTDISRSARLLYAILLTYTNKEGWCWPSVPTLAENLGASERYTRDLLRELEAKGCLETELKVNKPNRYRARNSSSARKYSSPHLPGSIVPSARKYSSAEVDKRSRYTNTPPIVPPINQNGVVSTILESEELNRRKIVPKKDQLQPAVKHWEELYPKDHITTELKKSLSWLVSNRDRGPKKSFIRFFNNWLSNSKPEQKQKKDTAWDNLGGTHA